MKWLDEREENVRVELIVHPHNEAGIATAQSIIEQMEWISNTAINRC